MSNFKITDYLIVFILIMLSGNPVLYNDTIIKYSLTLTFVLAIFLIQNQHQSSIVRIVAFATTFLVIGIIQFIQFSHFSLSIISLPMKIVVGSIIVLRFGRSFPYIYLNVLSALCAISLVFYLIQITAGVEAIPALIDTFFWSDTQRSIFIFNALTSDPFRNAGPMWEAGAFQAYINIAFMLVPLKYFRISLKEILQGLILLFALFTTFSTTGYIVFFLILIGKLLFNDKISAKSFVSVIFFSTVGISSFYSIDFLGDKIFTQIEMMSTFEEFDPGRFTVLEYDWHYIQKSPIFGNGSAEATRWLDHPELQGLNLGHGNGFSGFIAEMGIFGIFIYLIQLYRSSFFLHRKDAIGFMIVIVLLLQGEHLLSLPFFLGLPFLNNREYK